MAIVPITLQIIPRSERHNKNGTEAYLEHPSVQLDIWRGTNFGGISDIHRCQDIGDLPGETTPKKGFQEAEKWLKDNDNLESMVDAIIEVVRLYTIP